MKLLHHKSNCQKDLNVKIRIINTKNKMSCRAIHTNLISFPFRVDATSTGKKLHKATTTKVTVKFRKDNNNCNEEAKKATGRTLEKGGRS